MHEQSHSKCQEVCLQVYRLPILWSHITPDGLKIDPKKVEAILSMEAPTDLKDLQSFLGLVKY